MAQEVAAAQAAEADQVQQFGTDGTANVNETEIVPPLQLDEHGGFGTLDVDVRCSDSDISRRSNPKADKLWRRPTQIEILRMVTIMNRKWNAHMEEMLMIGN